MNDTSKPTTSALLLVIIIPSQMRELAPADPGRPFGLGAIPALVVPYLPD